MRFGLHCGYDVLCRSDRHPRPRGGHGAQGRGQRGRADRGMRNRRPCARSV